MNGTVTVIDKSAVRIHSYMAPDDSLNVTTQLIETPARVIAVDAQYALAYADEVVAYARALGKPLDRVIITHAHPDHFHGAARFGAPVHALAAVRDQNALLGELDDQFVGRLAAPVRLEDEPDAVDDLGARRDLHGRCHVGDRDDRPRRVLAVALGGDLVAQDLVYHATHLFLGNNDVAGWVKAVDELAAAPGYDTVLAGHGLPASPEVFDQLRAYLADAGELLGDDGEAYKQAITARYPGFGGPFLIDIGNQYLFGAGNAENSENAESA